jgi:hypothetical protein
VEVADVACGAVAGFVVVSVSVFVLSLVLCVVASVEPVLAAVDSGVVAVGVLTGAWAVDSVTVVARSVGMLVTADRAAGVGDGFSDLLTYLL